MLTKTEIMKGQKPKGITASDKINQQKISDNRNHSLGYFIQSVETEASNYIIRTYQGVFDDFNDILKNKLHKERSAEGHGVKIDDFNELLELIDSFKHKFGEFRELLQPSIAEGILDEIMGEHKKDD